MISKDALIALLLITMFVALLAPGLKSQPVRDRILGDVEITDDGECVDIQVAFNFPVQYVKHFPFETGGEVRTQLLPILISPIDKKALFKRESVRPPVDNLAGLSDIIYEGDMEGGPFLALMFQTPVAFKVKQGSDYRSLTVIVSLETENPLSCFQEQ